MGGWVVPLQHIQGGVGGVAEKAGRPPARRTADPPAMPATDAPRKPARPARVKTEKGDSEEPAPMKTALRGDGLTRHDVCIMCGVFISQEEDRRSKTVGHLRTMLKNRWRETPYVWQIIRSVTDAEASDAARMMICTACVNWLRRSVPTNKDAEREAAKKSYLLLDRLICFSLAPGEIACPDYRNMKRLIECLTRTWEVDGHTMHNYYSAVIPRHLRQALAECGGIVDVCVRKIVLLWFEQMHNRSPVFRHPNTAYVVRKALLSQWSPGINCAPHGEEGIGLETCVSALTIGSPKHPPQSSTPFEHNPHELDLPVGKPPKEEGGETEDDSGDGDEDHADGHPDENRNPNSGGSLLDYFLGRIDRIIPGTTCMPVNRVALIGRPKPVLQSPGGRPQRDAARPGRDRKVHPKGGAGRERKAGLLSTPDGRVEGVPHRGVGVGQRIPFSPTGEVCAPRRARYRDAPGADPNLLHTPPKCKRRLHP
eukprot:182705-Hanusia_phi.AAC.2